jgi:hypothetical protein
MNIIYSVAVLTIVAASREDANADMPGLMPGSRKKVQHIEEVQSQLKLTNGLSMIL